MSDFCQDARALDSISSAGRSQPKQPGLGGVQVPLPRRQSLQLHFAGLNFVFLCLYMLLLSRREGAAIERSREDLQSEQGWASARAASVVILVLVLALYAGLYLLGSSG